MAAIYKCFVIRRVTEAWYHLSEDERTDLLAKMNQARKDVGGETVSSYNIHWSNDGAFGFGVEKFPNIEAVQKHSQLLDELDWFRYLEVESFLGTENPSE